MKVVRVHEYGGPDVLRIDELPTPEPGPGQVRVRVEAAGVNFIDIYQRSGLYKNPLPLALGLEGAGTVQALGPGITELQVGDRVAWASVPGSFGTDVLAPADRLVPVPERVSARDAAAVMLQGMTAYYLTHATFPLKPGDTCLVHAAAGGVGLLLCQMAKQCGARVIGTTSTEAKAALAREAGADEVILYTQQDFEAEVKRLTGGRGVDVVYDSVGKDTFDKSLNCLRPLGYMVLLGQSSGPVPPVDPQILNSKGSLFLTRPSLFHYTATRDKLLEYAHAVLGMVASGQLRVRIDEVYPLERVAEAQVALASRKTSVKLLIVP